MKAEAHPVIGELRPNRFGMPGSPFREFTSKIGIEGLGYVENGELHLLAVHAITEGVGQFRMFIERSKAAYKFIRVWCVMNDDLRPVLERYGFVVGNDVDRYGQMQEVWDWRKV